MSFAHVMQGLTVADMIAMENRARWTDADWDAYEKGAAQTRASEASTAARVPNLDTPSLDLSGPSWRVTQRHFGNGVVEARVIYLDGMHRAKSPRDSVEKIISAEEREDKRAWRRARSRREMKWRTLCLRADHMITLTKRGKFETVDEAWSAWKSFLAYCRAMYGDAFKYVVVPEQHACGRWHLHCAVNGKWDVGMLRRFWYRALGGRGNERGEETPGSINARWFGKRNGSAVVAKYMAKYMGKAFDARGKNRRAYACSKGLQAEVEKWSEPVQEVGSLVHELIEKLSSRFGGTYEVYEWRESGLHGLIIKTRGT